MQNLFDSANYPQREPDELVVGSLWAWTRPDITLAYPTASYTLKYRLSQQETPFASIDITASKDTDAHAVTHTEALGSPAGQYSWQAVVVRDSDSAEVVVDRGFLKVIAALSGGEASSWVFKVLTAIRATLQGTASKEQQEYQIGGRTIISRPIGDLLMLEKEFSKRWNREQADADRQRGRRGRRVLVGMSA